MDDKEAFNITQIDCIVDSDAIYELLIETHFNCTEEEVIEALETIFHVVKLSQPKFSLYNVF